MSNQDIGAEANRALLIATVERLGELAEKFVFVGGCATGLLITSLRSQAIRVTIDVDVVTQVATLVDYYKITASLVAKGFYQAADSQSPICRWFSDGLQLDVVPADSKILGFSNRWYALAVATAQRYQLQSDRCIQLITAPLFLATKLDAFADRGRADFLASHDLEDFITVIDGRPEIESEVRCAPVEVRTYIGESLRSLLANPEFNLSLAGHLPTDSGSQARLPNLRYQLKTLADLN